MMWLLDTVDGQIDECRRYAAGFHYDSDHLTTLSKHICLLLVITAAIARGTLHHLRRLYLLFFVHIS